jgi:hypothetical protein
MPLISSSLAILVLLLLPLTLAALPACWIPARVSSLRRPRRRGAVGRRPGLA